MSRTREHSLLDVEKIREDFPILKTEVAGKPLVYLDNAATSQKPISVIRALEEYYCALNANIHRGVHFLSEKATDAYERARVKVQHFIHAQSFREIIFTRGTTEGINLVAQSYGRKNLQPGDEILLTLLEHHSNIVPWQMIAEEKGAKIQVVPINEQGELEIEAYEKLLNERTKIVALGHISNALGTINPIRSMIDLAHQAGAVVLIDGAQATPHLAVDVQELDCEFYAFSGHKMFGPSGIGVLYGKEKILETMPPYQGGGDMIRTVSFEKTTYNDLPYKFEAGTPHISGAIGLGVAINYLEGIGLEQIESHEHGLLEYATDALSQIPGLQLIGTAREKASVVSFVMEEVHPHDIGTILDSEGIAIRTGHHCAMPLMHHLKLAATSRASFAFYNTQEEIDALAKGLFKVRKLFAS